MRLRSRGLPTPVLEDPQCKLEKLWLISCHISVRGCALLSSALRSNSSLREMDLSDNDIKELGVKMVSNLLADPQCKLEKLGLRSCHISVRGCADLSSALRSNPSLRELDLSQNEITESGVEQLSNQLKHPRCKLEKLQLRSCGIRHKVNNLYYLSLTLRPKGSLRELDLSENEITDSGVKQISDLLKHPQCKLEKLGLRSCLISNRGCADLSSALRSNPSHLRELDLSENNIRDSGVKQLSDLLKHPQCKLEKLGLRSCLINDSGCADLSSALNKHSPLRELDLSNNYFLNSGLTKFSDLLRHPQCKLEKLGLRSCCIGDHGFGVLSSVLRLNPSHLRDLDLSENTITDSGVKQLSDLLEDPQCKLEKLGLRSCKITNRGCAALSSALTSNPSHLRELDLSDNYITDSGVKQLSDLLKDSQCKLEKLWLKLGTVKYAVLRTNTISVNWSETADLVTEFDNLILNK